MTNSRLILLTGGSRGLGRAAALALADAGADLVITYTSQPDAAAAVVAEITARGRTAVALPLDTSAPAGFPAFLDALRATLQETWGRTDIDGLVNNAGFGALTPTGSVDEATVRSLFDVHIIGPILLTEALLPHIVDGGRILNVSTGLARFIAGPYSAYAAAKGAVEVWTRYLAQEVGPRGIAVNAIAPGATATDFGGGAVRDNADINAHIASTVALGRVGDADDIGAAVAAILDPRMGWVTGQRIEASGGQRL